MTCLIVAGKLFHIRGPATAKLLSPRVVRVRGTASVLYRKMSGDDDDHAQRRVECRQIGRPTSVLSRNRLVSNKCIAVRKVATPLRGTHMPHGITQCYLPPGRGDIPAEAGTRLSDPGGMQG